MACEIQKYIQISPIWVPLQLSCIPLPGTTTSTEMLEVSAVRKLDAQLASDALVQAFILQRNPSVTMTFKTMISGLVTVFWSLQRDISMDIR